MASISGGNTYGTYQGNVNMIPPGQKSLIAPPTTASPSTSNSSPDKAAGAGATSFTGSVGAGNKTNTGNSNTPSGNYYTRYKVP